MRSLFYFCFLFVGTLNVVASPIDLTVVGDGLIPLSSPSGEFVYAKTGRFARTGEGDVVLMSEKFQLMAYSVDENGNIGSVLSPVYLWDSQFHRISEDGKVMAAVMSHGVGSLRVIAQIPIAVFEREDLLNPIGGGMFQPSQSSGIANIGIALTNGRGKIIRGWLRNMPKPLSFSVSGNGYFVLQSPDSHWVYARNAKILHSTKLKTIKGGYAILGYLMDEAGNISNTMNSITLNNLGQYVFQRDGTLWDVFQQRAIAKIPLATFMGEDFLTPLGGGIFQESSYSGASMIGLADTAGRGEVVVK